MSITRKRYSIADVKKIRTLYKRGKSFEEIGKAVKRSTNAIQVFISRMGWTKGGLKKNRKSYTDTEDSLIWQWRSAGHKNKQIAAGLGRTYGAVRQRVSTIGV